MNNGVMVLVTFAETKVTGPPGPVPATTSHEVANKPRAASLHLGECPGVVTEHRHIIPPHPNLLPEGEGTKTFNIPL